MQIASHTQTNGNDLMEYSNKLFDVQMDNKRKDS
jgi:hypothetical protein